MQIFLNNHVGQTCEKASFANFHERYCAVCGPSLQNFPKNIMAAIPAGRTSFLDFYFQNGKFIDICFLNIPLLLWVIRLIKQEYFLP